MFKVTTFVLLLLGTISSVLAQFQFFDQFFGGQQQQQGQPQGKQNVPSDSSWYKQNWEGAHCSNYLCPDTLACVAFPHHCPCPHEAVEEKVELGEGIAVCASKGGFKAGETLRKVELARKGLLHTVHYHSEQVLKWAYKRGFQVLMKKSDLPHYAHGISKYLLAPGRDSKESDGLLDVFTTVQENLFDESFCILVAHVSMKRCLPQYLLHIKSKSSGREDGEDVAMACSDNTAMTLSDNDSGINQYTSCTLPYPKERILLTSLTLISFILVCCYSQSVVGMEWKTIT